MVPIPSIGSLIVPLRWYLDGGFASRSPADRARLVSQFAVEVKTTTSTARKKQERVADVPSVRNS